MEGVRAMNQTLVIHRVNSGWLESEDGVSLMGAGRHPDVPGGQIRSYGWQDDIVRPDGSTVSGTMVPAPAWYIEGTSKRILIDTGMGKADEVMAVQRRYGISLAARNDPEDDVLLRLDRLGVRPEQI